MEVLWKNCGQWKNWFMVLFPCQKTWSLEVSKLAETMPLKSQRPVTTRQVHVVASPWTLYMGEAKQKVALLEP